MRRLEFTGKVDSDGGGLCDWGPHIDGRDVIEEIEELWPWQGGVPKAEVKALLGVEPLSLDQVASGEMFTCHGFGGTDVTPPEWPEIKIGDGDLVNNLRDYDGRTVVLIVQDADD